MLGKWRAATVVLLLALMPVAGSTVTAAVEPDEILPDAAMEKRARDISAGLRCLVCQNQSIDDSHAPLARDLRLLVRERLKAGDSDTAVLDFIVARYGEFVLLKPPVNGATLLLWLTPVLVLLGGLVLVRSSRSKLAASEATDTRLTPDEQKKLDSLLKGEGGQS